MSLNVLIEIYAQCFPNRNAVKEINALGTSFEYKLIEDKCFLTYRKTSLEEAEILDIGTVPGHRMKGLGKTLFQQTIDELRSEGVKEIYLEVAEDNHVAKEVYEKFGFEAYNRRKNYYKSDGKGLVDAILMKKVVQ